MSYCGRGFSILHGVINNKEIIKIARVDAWYTHWVMLIECGGIVDKGRQDELCKNDHGEEGEGYCIQETV